MEGKHGLGERINISPDIIVGVAWMVVESGKSSKVAVSHRPPEEPAVSKSGRQKLDTGSF